MKRKTVDIFFVFIFCITVFITGISIVASQPRAFSQKENRPLALKPTLSLASVTDGSFFESLGKYYKDQFPLRDTLTALRSISELSLGKLETGGVIPTFDGRLVALPSYNNIDRIEYDLEKMYSVCEKINAVLYIPPRSIDIFSQSLPSIYDRDKVDLPLSLFRKETADMISELTAREDSHSLYYATDHHWTTDGAYIAYTQICKQFKIIPYGKEYFNRQTVSQEFFGTSFSSSALPCSALTPDSVVLYRYSGDDAVTVINRETGVTEHGFYRYSALSEKDKYKVFLGGNYSHVSILSGQNKGRLLLIKDSFANSLVPFLALHYDIEMLDPRYCEKELIQKYLQEDVFDAVLFLLSIDTLDTLE